MKVGARHLYFNLWGLLQKKVYRNKVTPSERKSLHCVSCRTWVIIKSRQIWLLMARLGSKLLHALISCSFKRGGPYLMIMGRTWKIKADFMFFCRKLWEFFRIYILQKNILRKAWMNKQIFLYRNVVAESGHLELLNHVIEKTGDSNPKLPKGKVWVFWEGHKIWKNVCRTFDKSIVQAVCPNS